MAVVSTPNSQSRPSVAARSPQMDPAPVGDATAASDPQLVAEMKHEINALVQEITQLAAQDITPEEFYGGFLARIVSAIPSR
jgi:hypothetical protein